MSNKTNRRQSGLRRVDWRFLLPTPDGTFQHLALLGGTPLLAERILEAGIAQRVSLTLPGKHSADVVAKLYNSQAQLNDIVESLTPGGVVYYEVQRRSIKHVTHTPGRILSRLGKAGLISAGIYWVGPDFENCKRYIPLDIPEAFQWYLSTLHQAGTPLHSLLQTILQRYTKTGTRRFTPLAPCYAVTAQASQHTGSAPSVLAHPSLPIELRQPDLRPIVLTSGQDDGSRAILLPFAPGRSHPLAVLKISTLAGHNAATILEQTRLNEMRACLDGAMLDTIPQPLGLLRYGDFAVSMESYAEGHSLSVSSGRWRVPLKQQIADLHLAASWLSEFQHQTRIRRVTWDDSSIEKCLETPLAKYAELFGLTPQEECLFGRVRELAASLTGASMPLVRMHYDFGPWNLYRSERGFAVIDWEFDRDWNRDEFGPSLYDLLYFITHWMHLVYRAFHQEAELHTFYTLFVDSNRQDPYTKAAHAVLAQHTADQYIDRRFIPLMLVYVWVEQAIYQVVRKRALGSTQENLRLNNPRVMRLDILARHVEQFFARASGDLAVT